MLYFMMTKRRVLVPVACVLNVKKNLKTLLLTALTLSMFRQWCLDQGKICQSVITLLAYFFNSNHCRHHPTQCAQSNRSLYRGRSSLDGYQPTEEKFLIVDYLQQFSKTELESVTVGESEITMQISSVRNLVARVDRNLSMSIHVSKVCSMAFRVSRSIFPQTDHPGV